MQRTRVIRPPVLYPGTPVVLVSSRNADGSANLAPMSSAWALGDLMVLGLGTGGQTFANLSARPDCVINYAGADLWRQVEALAPLTGADPVPEHKRQQFRTERDKFGAAGLTPRASELVTAPRVAECPIQVECRVAGVRKVEPDGVGIVEVRVLRVHVHDFLAEPDDRHLRVDAWRPLFYLFRHYAGRGPELGRSFRATTSQPALDGQPGPGEQAGPEHGDHRHDGQRDHDVEPRHGDRERGRGRPLVGVAGVERAQHRDGGAEAGGGAEQ
jgi:flavin reductase (DIM6/NTAB) family NADH-FMN oxidoreductase RutF